MAFDENIMKKRVIKGEAHRNLKFWAKQQECKENIILFAIFGGKVFQPLRGGEVPPGASLTKIPTFSVNPLLNGQPVRQPGSSQNILALLKSAVPPPSPGN